tara:strand:- start:2058 stop:2489 length:432 start_codon:yes stop_codon:yes gene_type:complete
MAHRWGKPTKRKQRIDPRYFLEETTTRDEEILEEEDPAGEDIEDVEAPQLEEAASAEEILTKRYDYLQKQGGELRRSMDPGGSSYYGPEMAAASEKELQQNEKELDRLLQQLLKLRDRGQIKNPKMLDALETHEKYKARQGEL